MKIGRFSLPFSLSGAAIALIVIQLALVSCFRRQVPLPALDLPAARGPAPLAPNPESSLHGRYLRLQLMVDGCQSTLPSAKLATFPRDVNGAVKPGPFALRPQSRSPRISTPISKLVNNRLVAVRVEGQEDATAGEGITAMPGTPCDQMSLDAPVDFLSSEAHAQPTAAQARPGAVGRGNGAAEGSAAAASSGAEAGWSLEAAGVPIDRVCGSGQAVTTPLKPRFVTKARL